MSIGANPVKNQIAVALGRLAAGHPKTLSRSERARRRAAIARARTFRKVRVPKQA